MATKFHKELEGLHASSHEVGTKWLAAAMHPPTKSDNPGFPDSDRAASVRTNSNINYTVAPPGAVSTSPDATWNCSIITTPNNPYHPGIIVAYITEYYNMVETYIKSDRVSSTYTQPEDNGTHVRFTLYHDVINGANTHVGLNKDMAYVDITSQDCVAYFTSIRDNYMPSYDEVEGWRCIGASNTTYLDCAEMFKQGVVYGSHAPKPADSPVGVSVMNPTYISSAANLYNAIGESVDLTEEELESYSYHGVSDLDITKLFGHQFDSIPNGLIDGSYAVVKYNTKGLELALSLYSVTPGQLNIANPVFGYSQGDTVTVNGTSGSMVILESEGITQKINGTAYIAAMVSAKISGPQLTQVNEPVYIYPSQVRDFGILNGVLSKDKSVWLTSEGKVDLYSADDWNVARLGGLAESAQVPGTVVTFPLDRQSMQANSEMMQQEAKHGSYQVARLLDSENSYSMSAKTSTCNIFSDAGKTIGYSNIKSDRLKYATKSHHSPLQGNNHFIVPNRSPLGHAPIRPAHHGPLCGTPVECMTPDIVASRGEVCPQLFDYHSLASTRSWSSPVILYIGLSARSSIQAKICRDIEIIPTANSALAPLSSVGALSDEQAIYNGVLLLNNIPVLMMHKDNDLGSFLRAAWSAVKAAAPAIVSGTTAAFGPAGGAAAASALASGKAIEKMVTDIRKLKTAIKHLCV